MDLKFFAKISQNKSGENKKFLLGLKKKDVRRVDDAFHSTHEEVFEKTDCLSCANCCKTTSPIFYANDIERLAKFLRMKPGSFIDEFLRIDEDNDYVLKTSPCSFLAEDNRCKVYEVRPKACREYPHTNRKKMFQVLDLAHKNSMVCPAVYEIIENLKSKFVF